MKTLFKTLLLILVTVNILKSQNEMDTVSYSIGVILAENLKSQGLKDFDSAVLADAMKDHLAGEGKVNLEDASQIFTEALEKAKMGQYESIKVEGEQFLAENGKRDGVTTTDSGLQYEIIKPGNGLKPKATDKVNVHYHGTLITGEVFDSSVERGEPISFPLNGVIAGWTEGLQHMPVGSKYKLFIPYDLAYGARGAGAAIKPYSALIFEVELLEIQ